MAFSLAIGAFLYDHLMIRNHRRWLVLWLIIAVAASIFAVASSNPVKWIILHLTLDPQTGYFRILIWDTAFDYIAHSPWIGYAYQSFGNDIIDGSVDSIWLLDTLRFGIPMLLLFFATNISAVLPERQVTGAGGDDYLARMRRAFTIVILLFMFTGLTVHFWNFMWMFWGQCVGVRVSLREPSFMSPSR